MTLTVIGLIRGALTAILCAAFIALWIWAWSKHRKAEFDAAAQLPLEDDAVAARAHSSSDH
ncbi:MAG: cbb3-type cytochrome c oxidase subunit 3 [Pseudomonadota bacterium]|nr:cbb3-type cytochrome c oxidase subunit 3 [Pseudomonadota bacterium]